MIRSSVPWVAFAIISALNAPVADVAAEEVDESTAAERAGRMSIMSRLVGEVRLFETIEGREVELKRSEMPVTRFNDNVRQFEDGSLWAYTRNGRPQALIKCSTNNSRTRRWWYCLTSLSTNRLRGERSSSNFWMPEQPGVEYRPLPDAQLPASTTNLRHRQLRQLARRFNAHQFWNPGNQRFELRLSPRPVLLYADESTGVLDGGVFVFTHGVSPALSLVIEAVRGDKTASWRYAIAKLGSAEFHASLDDKEVYQSPRATGVTGQPTDPYFLFPLMASE